jgi:DNA modification methylase
LEKNQGISLLTREKANFSDNTWLDIISEQDSRLLGHFRDKFVVHPKLNRQLVSFQANKDRPAFRWFKFKEAFSASLVELLLQKYSIKSGRILDPFAGSGTALFAASNIGLDSDGIEILPVGQQIIAARLCLECNFAEEDFRAIKRWTTNLPWRYSTEKTPLCELRITKGAYSTETLENIERYLAAIRHENERVQTILRFALLCVLESISYTRKDGQFLRWDHRSSRNLRGKVFHKNRIEDFNSAIVSKLIEIMDDTAQTQKSLMPRSRGQIKVMAGSCLDILSTLRENYYDSIFTSPPYSNRYDYTRTYALELAALGIGEHEIVNLRQQMLSCTVENREKDLMRINPNWSAAIEIADKQELLQSILGFLEDQKAKGKLNNNGIPRMLRGYFYEMACVIFECARVMKNNALMFMVNDNVKYAGASVSVDMILSEMAEETGFSVENILVLPDGKGNSSQQMGIHGYELLRKCVYVWRKK